MTYPPNPPLAERPSTLTIQPIIVFRCDGNRHTGLGHTSRSLALAEALIDLGCRCHFLGWFDAPVEQRLRAAGIQSTALDVPAWSSDDARALTELVTQTQACGIVIDSYDVSADYIETIETHAAPVLLIDDFAALSRYPCSAVLNFTSRVDEFHYPQNHTRYFLGLNWFLSRRALRQLRSRGSRPAGQVQNVLVASGGSDPYDIVLPVIEALLKCDRNLCVRIVISTEYSKRPALQALLDQFQGQTTTLTNLPDLSEELGRADLCISGAGLTKYEIAYVGVPGAILSQNEGQAKDTVRFAALGLTCDLGLASQIDQVRLTNQITHVVHDQALRDALRQRGLATFPADPTRNLAEALLSEVFQCS